MQSGLIVVFILFTLLNLHGVTEARKYQNEVKAYKQKIEKYEKELGVDDNGKTYRRGEHTTR